MSATRNRPRDAGKMKVVAVVAGGGSGTRMSSAVPKQLLELAGKPILLHTIERILSLENIVQLVVALPAGQIRKVQALLRRQGWKIPTKCVPGGPSRQESVRRAVTQALPRANLILVHDAVRPLCDAETMQRVLEAAWLNGGAVPGLPATETIQRVSRRGRVLSTPPRDELYAIQTPQCFRSAILRAALERAHRAGFDGTDESSVVRWAGHPVTVVAGSPDNIKITHPLDLEIAELRLRGPGRRAAPAARGDSGSRMNRVGQGIDYHRLVKGRRLVLGGVEIPYGKGLKGHSDADVLCHAICDAILGAAALGDIGSHFPDNDPANRNRRSLEFLSEAVAKIERAGWMLRNVDATLLVQRPKLAPYMGRMQRNLARALGIGIDQVSVKATTTEGLNAEGRGEGISAQGVALLERKA